MPSGKHGGGGGGDVAAVVGAEDGGLVAFFVEAAEFAQPEAVAEVGAAFGEVEGEGVAVLEGDLVGGKVFQRKLSRHNNHSCRTDEKSGERPSLHFYPPIG